MIGDELLAVAEAAARAAASELLAHQDEAHSSVESKSTPTDPVSAADLAAESAIRAVLAEQRPDDAILGEEGDDSPGTSGLRWVVDPLDGTVNYLYAIPQWCVSVACEGQVGVIFDPLGDELFSVIVGQRPLLNGEPIAPSGCERVDRALVATGFGYDPAVRLGQGAIVAELLGHVRDIRRGGSAALDLAWTAAGRYDAYFERGVQDWDTAAGLLICEAAGLSTRTLDPSGAQGAGVLVAAPQMIDQLFEVVAAA